MNNDQLEAIDRLMTPKADDNIYTLRARVESDASVMRSMGGASGSRPARSPEWRKRRDKAKAIAKASKRRNRE